MPTKPKHKTTTRESPQAMAAYAAYEAMGPERSLRKLHETYLKADGTPRTTRRQLEIWSATLDWQTRVGEYDAEQERKKGEKRRAEIEKMNERHALIATTQQARAIQQIDRLIQAKKFGSQAAVQLLKVMTDLERIARGAPTTVEQHEVTGKDGGPIRIGVIDDDPEASALARALIARATTGGTSDASGPSVSGE